MELVGVDLDASADLNATEYAEVAGAELVSCTDLDSGYGKRMERNCDSRRKSGRGQHQRSPSCE
jgi:hypothetical protein